MAIGDLLFGLLGQPNPQQQMAQAFGQYPGQAGSRSGPVPGSGAGAAAPGLSQAGGAANVPGQPPQPNAPPQPQAYQSPPDLGQMYMNIIQRQQANAGINTGLGLLAGAFSHNQADRDNMLSAMQNLNQTQGGGNVGEQIGTLANLQQTMWQRQMLMQQYAMAPVYAKQLNIPVEQVQAYIAAGKLPDIMNEVAKQKMLQADPLHQAQVGSTQAEVPLKQAQTTEAGAQTQKAQAETRAIPATVAKTQAETAAIPITTAKTQAETAAIPATVAKTQAETAAIPATVQKTQAETAVAQATAAKAAADAAARANMQNIINDPNFTQKYHMTPDQAKAMPPDELAKVLATGPQTAAETTAKAGAEVTSSAQQTLDSLRASYDKQNELINNITSQPDILNEITGQVAGRVPTSVAPLLSGRFNPQSAHDLQAQIDQLADMGFITGAHAVRQAVGGKVTNTEAKAGNEAETRLHDQTQSLPAYLDAIKQVKLESDRNMAIAYRQAGIPIPDDLPDVKKAAAILVGTGVTTGASPAPSPAPKELPTKKWVRNPKTNQLELQQ
jgi:hypothetical protein